MRAKLAVYEASGLSVSLANSVRLPSPVALPDNEPIVANSACGNPVDPLPPSAASAHQTLLPRQRTLRLGKGFVLEFMNEQVPTLPSVSFAAKTNATDGIKILNSMWDHESDHWGGTLYLNINGKPIAIKYWREIHSRQRFEGWELIKRDFSEWQVRFFRNIMLIRIN